ncbi:hypothetical protein [Desulfobacter latus]|uniref:Uncharacterized protein n=1 Tax=Desulfobacter latus TaxID=2292 RepID=A0A850SYA7_9BACT|nr:hypothetical protein [Desulfobacter latus]NWH06179.1 hypothetical protein [Desulfobacter latus]
MNNSFKRIKSVFEVYEGHTDVGTSGVVNNLPNFVYSDASSKYILAEMIQPDFIIDGSLFLATATKKIITDTELINAGIHGKVVAYDICMELKALQAVSRHVMVTHSLKVRIYGIEQGGSLFYMIKDEFITQGNASFIRTPNLQGGLEYLSDYLTAAVLRDLSTLLLGRSFRMCGPSQDNSNIPSYSNDMDQKALSIKLKKTKDGICAQVKPLPGKQSSLNGRIGFYWRQFASNEGLDIPIGPALFSSFPAQDLKKGPCTICLPAHYIVPHAKTFELEIRTEPSKKWLGTGVI